MAEEIEELSKKLDVIEEQVENGDFEDFEENVLEVEEQVKELEGQAFEATEIALVENLINRIKELKKEGNFYDEEAELDRMFPDRHEPDLDQDSTTFDSIFKEN